MPHVRRWVVLTSWDGRERGGMVLSVTQDSVTPERVIFTSYAAVATAGGWLVIQL
jgi:signal recognition particle GTPase